MPAVQNHGPPPMPPYGGPMGGAPPMNMGGQNRYSDMGSNSMSGMGNSQNFFQDTGPIGDTVFVANVRPFFQLKK